MLSEYEKINNREHRIMKNYHASPATWANFLAAAGKFYEEVTSNQSLIASQNPKATLLKTVEEWNQKYCCYLKPEAKPVKLLMFENGQHFVKSVYDQKDVCKAVDSIEIPQPWKLREEHKEPVMAMLEKEVGPTDHNKSFDERLMQIADIIIDYNKDELAQRAISAGVYYTYIPITFIQREELANNVRDTFSASLSYLLLSRCGSNMRAWRKEREFSYLDGFKDLPAISWAACTLTGFGKQVLLGIENTIQENDRQQIQSIKSNVVNMPQIETREKHVRSVPQQPVAKIEKVAETPITKSYIRGKLESNKQITAKSVSNKTSRKQEIAL